MDDQTQNPNPMNPAPTGDAGVGAPAGNVGGDAPAPEPTMPNPAPAAPEPTVPVAGGDQPATGDQPVGEGADGGSTPPAQPTV